MTLLNQLNTLESSGLLQLAAVQPELEYIFRHALVQDAAYSSLLKQDRKQLHQAVAKTLEKLYPNQLDDYAATLAYHFEQAAALEKAVHYLVRAGDHAYHSYANAEAIAFYQTALRHISDSLLPHQPTQWRGTLAQLWEKLAEAVERTGQHEPARAHFQQALSMTDNEPLTQARLYRRIGAAHTIERHFAEALQEWKKAEQVLGKPTEESAPTHWHEWIEIQVERLWAHYWQNQVEGMEEICRELIPLSEQYGAALQRSRTWICFALYCFRRERYVASDETLVKALTGLQVVLTTGRPDLSHDAHFQMGFFHLFRREFAEADENLHQCLAFAGRLGDPLRQARAHNYLMVLARMRGQVEAALSYLPAILKTTWAGPMADYTPQVCACKAWAAWRSGDLREAQAHGLAAYDADQKIVVKFPFRWTFLFPLLAVAVSANELAAARQYAQELLAPNQMRLPDDLTARLDTGGSSSDDELTRQQLTAALTLAQGYGYL